MSSIPTFSIAGRPIGGNEAPYVVAEMSGNHRGSLETAIDIVHAAADGGAHAVKLQTYTPGTLTIDSHRPEFVIQNEGGLWHSRRLWDLYMEAHTPWEWHVPLMEAIKSREMAFISTAFDQSSLDFLIEIGVDAIKIASFELIHLPLISAAARSRKPLLLSTGMATLQEISDAVSTIRENDAEEFVLLKCTSAYPAVECDANVATMIDMQKRFKCLVGISDHTLAPYVSYGAVAIGACLVEKHLTLSRDKGGPDAAFSIEPEELRSLVDGASKIWRSVGAVTYGPLESEKTSLKERPSIYAVQEIRKGEKCTEKNLRVIRPADGLPPKLFNALIGRRARVDIAAATPMRAEYVDGTI